jgi:molybdenum cofactor guanylyltransferase
MGMSVVARVNCDAWILSGGESLRMGGQDKGLIRLGEHPMAWQVAKHFEPHVQQVRVNANRHLQVYQTWPWPVHADDADLPSHSGPMVGALTGLRHSMADWVQLAACDTPHLPCDLTARLYLAAQSEHALAAVPVTRQAHGHVLWHHWTGALVARSCADDLQRSILQGERRLGKWLTQLRWVAVMFDEPRVSEYAMFANINSPADLPNHAPNHTTINSPRSRPD